MTEEETALNRLERQRNHNRGLAEEMARAGYPVQIPPTNLTLTQFLIEKLIGPIGSEPYSEFLLEYEQEMGKKLDEAAATVRAHMAEVEAAQAKAAADAAEKELVLPGGGRVRDLRAVKGGRA